jgi:hypothetical protein
VKWLKAIMATPLALMLAASSCDQGWTPSGPPGDPTPLPASLVGIGVSPIDPTVTYGEQVQFIATGFYDDQTTRTITDSVDWYSTASSVIDVSSSMDMEGMGTTVGAGQAHVGCDYYGLVSNEVRVTVTEATLTSLVVLPSSAQLHGGEKVQLEAEASFSDGSHGNVSGSVRWITDDAAVATVDVQGQVTGEALGTTTVRAVYETGDLTYEGTPATIEVLDGSVTIDEPDVRILGVSATATGGSVTWTVEVKNSGGSSASGFWVDVWLNRTAAPPPPPASGDAYQMISVLEPGGSQDVTIQLEDVEPGSYLSWVMVDSFDSVAEGSLGENNNIWGPETTQVSGSGGPIGPDLSITYLQAFVQEAQGQVLYIIDVTNTGDQSSNAFSVGVFADPEFPPVAPDHPDEAVEVTQLDAGDTAYLSVTVRDMPDDYWQSYVLVDVGAQVAEPNESNNLASFQVVP